MLFTWTSWRFTMRLISRQTILRHQAYADCKQRAPGWMQRQKNLVPRTPQGKILPCQGKEWPQKPRMGRSQEKRQTRRMQRGRKRNPQRREGLLPRRTRRERPWEAERGRRSRSIRQVESSARSIAGGCTEEKGRKGRGRAHHGWNLEPKCYKLCSGTCPEQWGQAAGLFESEEPWRCAEESEGEENSGPRGAKRQYYEALERADSHLQYGWKAGSERSISAAASTRRSEWEGGQREEEEGKEGQEEKEKEGGKERKVEEEKEEERRREPRILRRVIRLQQANKGVKLKLFEFRHRVAGFTASSEKKIRRKARGSISATAGQSGRASGRGGGVPSSRRHRAEWDKNPHLLQCPDQRRGESHVQGRSGTLFDRRLIRLVAVRSIGKDGRWASSSFLCAASGSTGRRLELGKELGNTHPRTALRCGDTGDPGGPQAHQVAGENERLSRQPARELESRQLAEQLDTPQQGLGGHKRKREERKPKRKGRSLAERKRQKSIPQTTGSAVGGIGPKDGQGREGQVEISLGERLEAESEKFSGSCSMSELGIQVWWILQRADENSRQTFFKTFASRQKEFFREVCQNLRVTRKKRALFPLPNFWESTLTDFPDVDLLQLTERNKRETSDFAVACWCSLAVLFVNHLHDKRWQYASEQPTKSQRDMLMQIQEGVQRVLKEDCLVTWGEAEIKKDLSKKNVSYNGEEVSRPETLEIEQVLPGLPPQDHGGRIPITEWVSGKCKWYLEHPKECLLGPDTEPGVKLTAKVHVKPEDKLALGKLLVERRICRWTREDHVLCHKGEKVLNGLFGVEKPKRLPSGKPILRLIMNLIPSNSIHKTLSGRVHQLPHITRWAGLVLEEGEVLHVCQSDMQSAFYLFSLPEDWSCHLSFNLWAWGSELGLTGSEEQMRFYLSCAVLPMGWSSAVGVMQFVAEEVLYRNGMEKVTQIRRSNVLPEWMIRSCEDAAQEGKYWWHVYLDNYASGEKVQTGSPKAGEWQVLVEGWWEQAGIVTSKDKTIKDATTATELGAFISGNNRWIGASCERLLKVCKTTLWLISQPTIPRKLLQVIMGRWVFIMQFRRPAMSHFEAVWEVISEKEKGEKVLAEVRRELLGAVLGCLLFHTFLGCRIQKEITCSDASATGGAVAVSYQLSRAGEEYLQSLEPGNAPLKVPVVCISLFNGIGAAFRCYDVAGVQLAGGIACDIHRPGHRVTSRRWPWVVLVGDIKDLTKESLETMLEEMDEFLEIHLWAGFPCVDLSSVKSNRLNLQGPQSSLIHEAIRVMKLLHELYPNKKLVFVFENVASMDQSARVEISELIGVQPFKVDPAQQVPMNRPRLCWTNVVLPESDCIQVEQIKRW